MGDFTGGVKYTGISALMQVVMSRSIINAGSGQLSVGECSSRRDACTNNTGYCVDSRSLPNALWKRKRSFVMRFCQSSFEFFFRSTAVIPS